MMNLVIRLIFLGLIIGGLIHFSENPSGISILIIISIAVASVVSDEQICIYESYWEFNKLYVGGLLVRRNKYDYNKIKIIKIDGELVENENFIQDSIADRHFQYLKNEIEITFTDDQKITIKTNFSRTDLRNALKLINNRLTKSTLP
jgi:hypothetical protein